MHGVGVGLQGCQRAVLDHLGAVGEETAGGFVVVAVSAALQARTTFVG